MKKLLSVILCAALALTGLLLASCSQSGDETSAKNDRFIEDVSTYKTARAYFDHNGNHYDSEMDEKDVQEIKALFSGKALFYDEIPSCGFGDDVKITFDGIHVFQLGCDRCGSVRDVDKDGYFGLSESEAERLFELLAKYGFYFPCV